jgi:hypothetical protein
MSSPLINPIPLPYQDPISESKKTFKGRTLQDVIEFLQEGIKSWVTDAWAQSFDTQAAQLASSPTQVNRIAQSSLSAAVPTTDLAGVTVVGGLYEVRTYQQIRTADGVSSSLQVTLGWTYLGVAQTETFAALTGDTTTTHLTGPTKTFRSDAGTPITYAVAYASNTPAKMKYALDLILNLVAS